ncbi:MAG: ABC transporter ATP-binding protein [Gammaproteobacteria bacterium]|nr:ABC transporter ATP-binding protein [Gammaproteobacteria bacterium]MYA66963.1 ABC transporter ATP-binding protein [Gammaproteobacteria bacterium]MYE29178.1 ABC transporter ATP-binding protein [Gammaproteobacteria bacterium]MYH46055.1 ABC transporter ATP-binding protein [Gammaproteobacteria bacterium]MYL14621.1 ABC transporter ATP-binding protein [Gammaproteobacteria bacterium]
MTVAISVNNLEKVYASGVVALKGVSLQVQQGDFFALLGPNGAGKSTFIGILSTLVKRSNGRVQIFGRDVDTHVYRTKLDLGVVPQEINFSQFEKVADIVMTQAGYYGLPRKLAAQRTEKYLKQLGLWEKRDVRSRLLSGGMKRRMMIARALVHEPRLLILDEPTAGVDIELRRSMWDFLLEINRAGTTIVLTTHYLEEAEQLCRNIAIIDEGRIIEDTSMKKLLLELDTHAYILDAEADFDRDLRHDEPGLSLHKVDSHSIEAVLSGGRDINSAIAVLDRLGIRIVSMRNKANRLEQLFLSRLRAGENQNEKRDG